MGISFDKARCSLLSLLMITFAVAGCESGHGEEGCPELCDRAAACPGNVGSRDECMAQCASDTEAVEEAGCEDAWETYLECRNHANDVCDLQSAHEECSIQWNALGTCTQRYCDENPSRCPNR